jgi:hypothetical protein
VGCRRTKGHSLAGGAGNGGVTPSFDKGATWGMKEVTEEVAATREAKSSKQGLQVTSAMNTCCRKTNKNYMTQLVTMKRISLSTSAIQKTRRRFMAEK